jgi:hypothetical protein
VKPAASCDVTPSDLVECDQYQPSNRKQEYSPKCRNTFNGIYITSPEIIFSKYNFICEERIQVFPCYLCGQIDEKNNIRM